MRSNSLEDAARNAAVLAESERLREQCGLTLRMIRKVLGREHQRGAIEDLAKGFVYVGGLTFKATYVWEDGAVYGQRVPQLCVLLKQIAGPPGSTPTGYDWFPIKDLADLGRKLEACK